jgi:hypothetical protein
MPVYTYTTFDDPAGTNTQAYGILGPDQRVLRERQRQSRLPL